MSHTIKKNFSYNLLLTLGGYLFAFITFPYVSRVLGVDNIGGVNFVDSIINYFVLFSMLGVSTIGIREVAKFKHDKTELEKSFRDIFLLNFIFTIITLLILIILILSIHKFNNFSTLFYIGIIKLLFNFCLVEWFFIGSENFKFITLRSTIIKALYVVCVFLLVRDKTDDKIYYFLTCLVIAVNAIFNWTYLKKFISLNIKGFNYRRYIKPISIYGFYMLLTSMYINFNIAYLGFVAGQKEVGYYTTVTKLYTILLSFFTAFTGVMLPRMTSLILEKKYDEFTENLKKSFSLLVLFSFPIIVFTMVFAKEIIFLLAGTGYEGAILPMQIVMPLLIIIGIEQILVLQILMPLKKDKVIMWNSFFGAILGLILNFLLVKYFKSIGSAIVWFSCEFLILCLSLYFAKRCIKFTFPYFELLRQLFYCIPIVGVCILLRSYFDSFSALMLGFFLTGLYYIIIGIKFEKNEILINLYNSVFFRSKFFLRGK